MPLPTKLQSISKKTTNATLAEKLIPESEADNHTKLWLKNNKKAIDSSNAFVEKRGLPLAKYRMF